MPKISQLSPAAVLDGTELTSIVQNGVTVSATTQDIADLAAASSSVVSVNGKLGVVVLVPSDIGAASAADLAIDIAAHDASAAAHGGIEVLFDAHDGSGGVSKHPLATTIAAGFSPPISGNATDFLAGDGSYQPLPSTTTQVPVERIAFADSPYVPSVTDDGLILCDATAGAIAVNLPAIDAANDGALFYIKKTDASANAVTISADAADNIDGAPSASIAAQYGSWTLVASYDAGGDSFWSIV